MPAEGEVRMIERVYRMNCDHCGKIVWAKDRIEQKFMATRTSPRGWVKGSDGKTFCSEEHRSLGLPDEDEINERRRLP